MSNQRWLSRPRKSFGVVPDVEVSDLGGRARREPPGDRIETPGVRQTVPFGEHEPGGPRPGSPGIPQRRVAGPGETQQLVVRAQEGRHFRLLRGGGAVGGDHHAVPVPRESLRVRPGPNPVDGASAQVEHGVEDRAGGSDSGMSGVMASESTVSRMTREPLG